jgi:hypothetical protein
MQSFAARYISGTFVGISCKYGANRQIVHPHTPYPRKHGCESEE